MARAISKIKQAEATIENLEIAVHGLKAIALGCNIKELEWQILYHEAKMQNARDRLEQVKTELGSYRGDNNV